MDMVESCLQLRKFCLREQIEPSSTYTPKFTLPCSRWTKTFSTNKNAKYLKYLTTVNKEMISFDLVHETQVTKLIERLPNKKSRGQDNISNILVKRLHYTIKIPLTIIYNK